VDAPATASVAVVVIATCPPAQVTASVTEETAKAWKKLAPAIANAMEVVATFRNVVVSASARTVIATIHWAPVSAPTAAVKVTVAAFKLE